MAKAPDPGRKRRAKGTSGWRFLGAGNARPDGPPDDAALTADVEAFIRANPELFEQTMQAMQNLADEFAKEHGRPPTEDEVVELLGFDDLSPEDLERLTTELEEEGAFDNILDEIDDADLDPFPPEGSDEDGDDEDEDDDKR